jgi:hypothetical protein
MPRSEFGGDICRSFAALAKTTSNQRQLIFMVRLIPAVGMLRGTIGLPGSSSINFTAKFPFAVGTNWNAFLTAPLNLTLDFPVNLSRQRAAIFSSGRFFATVFLVENFLFPIRCTIPASWRRAVTERKIAEVPESDGSEVVALLLMELDASLDFFNAATKDVDLSFRGEIDFHDTERSRDQDSRISADL